LPQQTHWGQSTGFLKGWVENEENCTGSIWIRHKGTSGKQSLPHNRSNHHSAGENVPTASFIAGGKTLCIKSTSDKCGHTFTDSSGLTTCSGQNGCWLPEEKSLGEKL
jgi:hypothetical protein